jgi:hypothetical protein
MGSGMPRRYDASRRLVKAGLAMPGRGPGSPPAQSNRRRAEIAAARFCASISFTVAWSIGSRQPVRATFGLEQLRPSSALQTHHGVDPNLSVSPERRHARFRQHCSGRCLSRQRLARARRHWITIGER